MLQIRGNWKFANIVNEIALAEEDNSAAASDGEDEDKLSQTYLEIHMKATAADMERRMKTAAEASKITKRGTEEAAKEAKVKTATANTTAFLSLLVGVHTERCKMFNIFSNVHYNI